MTLTLTALMLFGALFVGPAPLQAAMAPATFSCADVSEIPLAECNALEALFNSTGGPDWTSKPGWLVSNTPCSWFGVTCTTGRVTVIELDDNNLTGSLPASLEDLSNLRRLSLWRNEIGGTIPPQLGTLSRLRYLHLGDNKLTGQVPATISDLTSLEQLLLFSNQLNGGLPQSLGNLANLQVLELASNQLAGPIPSTLGSLSNLRLLGLGGNQFSGSIPTSLGNLSNLESLALTSNQLTGSIPATLGNLGNLQRLWLSDNRISGGIPEQLGNLSKLRTLTLARNRLGGELPSALGRLTSLQEMVLNSNQISGLVPLAFCDLSPFLSLDLGYNALEGADPCIESRDPFWEETQTMSPSDLEATVTAEGDVILSWTPILYQFDQGYYEISARLAGDIYAVIGQTDSKSESVYTVDGLEPGVTYNFRLRTFTAAHDTAPAFQQNDLWSTHGLPVAATMPGDGPSTRKLHVPLVGVES